MAQCYRSTSWGHFRMQLMLVFILVGEYCYYVGDFINVIYNFHTIVNPWTIYNKNTRMFYVFSIKGNFKIKKKYGLNPTSPETPPPYPPLMWTMFFTAQVMSYHERGEWWIREGLKKNQKVGFWPKRGRGVGAKTNLLIFFLFSSTNNEYSI